MAAILIVDDEPDMVALLDFNLRQAGFETMVATTGEQALAQASRRVPDLVLLDLMLPDVPGTELCRRLKAEPRTCNALLIILTAKVDEVDRVVCFELGADDYVTKPFSVRELVLRVRAVLRRAAASAGSSARVGPIRVDVQAHRAYVADDEILLTPVEFRLLVAFMARVGRAQSRSQLLAEVWDLPTRAESRTVDTHVKRLREKLGPARELLQTVRGVGYRLVDPSRKE